MFKNLKIQIAVILAVVGLGFSALADNHGHAKTADKKATATKAEVSDKKTTTKIPVEGMESEAQKYDGQKQMEKQTEKAGAAKAMKKGMGEAEKAGSEKAPAKKTN